MKNNLKDQRRRSYFLSIKFQTKLLSPKIDEFFSYGEAKSHKKRASGMAYQRAGPSGVASGGTPSAGEGIFWLAASPVDDQTIIYHLNG